jgi:uncharacterized Ntn-hydrolase superfamily protein
MTYSILARDPETGEMGVATQSQALAVGSSVPWAMTGVGVIATQSMGEPAYGQLGLEAMRSGLTASEALAALRSVDPHPDRRQVAMIDGRGRIALYTGAACVGAAGELVGDQCCAIANMVASEAVWQAMLRGFESSSGPLASRLLVALHAAEDAGGDIRGRRSAAVLVVCAERSGRPWRDILVDHRVDDDPDPVVRLDEIVGRSARYHRMVTAFETALDGEATAAADQLEGLAIEEPGEEPDLAMWRAIVLALAGRADDAASIFAALKRAPGGFVEIARELDRTGVVRPRGRVESLLPER